MASELKDLFTEPYNPLDPQVVVDPKLVSPIIVTPYQGDAVESTGGNMDTSQVKVEGIYQPLIQINNRFISYEKVISMSIYFTSFTPSIKITVDDSNNDIQFSDAPGMSSTISVIMTCPSNGTYKKMSLSFYIDNAEFFGDSIEYSGTYNVQGLNKVECKQIGQGKLSTYKMLKQVATDLQLGFAATEGCEDVADDRYRQIYSRTMKDYISEQIGLGGVDENSVFDAWIDMYGYIVLVNLPYIFNNLPDASQLTIFEDNAVPVTDGRYEPSEPNLTSRTITNAQGSNNSNLTFEKYCSILSNDVKNTGALVTYYYLTDPCITNKIELEQMQIIENSIDGKLKSDEYEFEHIEFGGCEMSDTPILKQQQLHSMYIQKIQGNQIEVEMKNPNFGLQRGTLICLVDVDYKSEHKGLINANAENVNANSPQYEDTDSDVMANSTANESKDVATDISAGRINTAVSGLYYIESMRFDFGEDTDNTRIQQFLFLYKVGQSNKLLNNMTTAKITK